MWTDRLVPAFWLRQSVAVGHVDTAFTWYIVVLRPSRRLEPVQVVVHATALQLLTQHMCLRVSK